MKESKLIDAVIIGGGFYGTMLALHLSCCLKRILILEKEKDILTKASYKNQARVHNGYHYPRSFLTAFRSHVNHNRFVKDFEGAVDGRIPMFYAIASNLSKTTARQFTKFCDQIGAEVSVAPQSFKALFNYRLIEEVFRVKEFIFNAEALREILRGRLEKGGVEIECGVSVESVESAKEFLVLHTNKKVYRTRQVFNCSYSGINLLLQNSCLPILPLKHELTEMPVVRVPEELAGTGVTIMDGPFFGVMPFPPKNLHTIHHVRYSPRLTWFGANSPGANGVGQSKYLYMIKDVARYIPVLSGTLYVESLYETRVVLAKSEANDSRPILFKANYGIPGFHIVMGGKIDNVYDVIEEVKRMPSLIS